MVKETGKNRIGQGKPGPGRPKGSANKTTSAAREAFEYAFEGIGGKDKLKEWANDPEHQTEFYRLYARMLPKPIDLSDMPEGTKAVLVIANG